MFDNLGSIDPDKFGKAMNISDPAKREAEIARLEKEAKYGTRKDMADRQIEHALKFAQTVPNPSKDVYNEYVTDKKSQYDKEDTKGLSDKGVVSIPVEDFIKIMNMETAEMRTEALMNYAPPGTSQAILDDKQNAKTVDKIPTIPVTAANEGKKFDSTSRSRLENLKDQMDNNETDEDDRRLDEEMLDAWDDGLV